MDRRHILHVHFHLPTREDPELYTRLLGQLEDLTPRVQALPPDGADLDTTGALRYFDCDPRGIAYLIQIRSSALYGVTTTIGSASNRMLAVMAADATPPGGTTFIGHDPESIGAFLRPRPVGALHGVGPATVRILTRHGLHTVGNLADARLPTVQRLLGTSVGRALHERANGHDPRPVLPQTLPRSTGAEHRFGHDELDPAEHRRALLGLAEKLGRRLRAETRATRSLTLTVRYADSSTTTRSQTLNEATQHSAALTRAAYNLYERLGLQRARVRRLTLCAEALQPAERAVRQLTFDPDDERARTLEAVADAARVRYRSDIVVPATLSPFRGQTGLSKHALGGS